ncbi:hypothetical protein AVO42_06305 [Thiomicrospira sp. XS5]|uniref:DUF4149 domain-containing protein n=1 Tax=Thiomicrospira sp. XS5 TaxID=1775636 RepID=UPI000749F331|nr:DUF4149 domain-containing protein [Thiomicrospira sp. XS5]KUJ74975.1 hypothetical protein AVO42_06305 [Thiomicrospira sp. XS5]
MHLALLMVLLTANVTIGYVVAPVLFGRLSSEMAGELMGVFLTGLYGFDLIFMSVLLLMLIVQKRFRAKREALLVVSSLLVAANLWGISPLMTELKSMGLATSPELFGMTFAQWHGISQALFMLMLGLLVVWGIGLRKGQTVKSA